MSTDLPRLVAPSHYAAGMLIIGIILLGMIAGAGAQMLLQRGTGINWPLAFATGLIGSFVGGLFFSFLAGDGLELRPSGIIGSIFGAVLVTLLWDWIQDRRRPQGSPRHRAPTSVLTGLASARTVAVTAGAAPRAVEPCRLAHAGGRLDAAT